MNKNTERRIPRHAAESGQAIVLMALMMVGLLAATGLAVDGGGMFFLWRDVRNATDASVLAGAFSRCSNKNLAGVNDAELQLRVKNAALDAAEANGFVDTDPEPNAGQYPDVIVYYPFVKTNPTHQALTDNFIDFPANANMLNYVGVSIKADKPKYFISIIYPGDLTVETFAVGQCTPRIDPSQVKGLVALGDCNDTISFRGDDGDLYTDFFTNGDIKFNGGGALNKIYGDVVYGPTVGEDEYDANNKTVYEVTDRFTPARKGTVTRATQELEDMLELDLESLYGPNSEFRAELEAAGGKYYYYDGDLTVRHDKANGVPHTLEGFYYVDGEVTLSNNILGPAGMSIVATGDIGVGTHMYGSADPTKQITYYIHDAIEGTVGDGILLATSVGNGQCGVNSIGIDYSGSVNTRGFMYAPNAPINMSFSSSKFWGATIGQSIQLSGSALEYRYDPSVIPFRPGSVSVPQ